MIEHFANMQLLLDSQIGPVTIMVSCVTFMLLALVLTIPSWNKVGVPLQWSASLGIMVFVWHPMYHFAHG